MAMDYYFRDDIEAEKDRQAKAAENTLTLASPEPKIQTMTAPAAPKPAAGNPYAAIGQAAGQPKPDANPFDAFRSALDAQDPFKAQVKQGISDALANPAAAADEAAGLARDRLAKSQQVEAERRRQQAGMAYGGAQTGQVDRAMDDYATEATLQRQDQEGQIRAERAAAIERNRASALGQATTLLGQEEQSKLTREQMALTASEGAKERASREGVAFAGLNLEEKRLAQDAMQFGSELEFRKSEAAAGRSEAAIQRAWQAAEAEKARASQEKIAYAGLDLERDKFSAADANAKQGLSLEASAQALQKMGMDQNMAYQYASLAQAKQLAEKGLDLQASAQELQKQGMAQEDARYYAGLAQQEKLAGQEIASREKLAYAQIGSTERLQASQQVFQSEQAKLDRSLQQLLSNDRIQAEFKLAEVNNAFQEKMQANGFVQEKDIETMRADLQKSLQERGINADAAKQIADQKFQELMAGRDQAFEEKMTNLKQAWATGERVSTQDWQAAMQAGDQQHQEIMAKLESTLRLDEASHAQLFQTTFQQMQNDFTLYRDQLGYNQETAARLSTQAFQERMQEAGFTHDEAMQGAQLSWQAWENSQNRASQEMMAAASLAQQDTQFMAELQQRYQFNATDITLRQQELNGQLELMGLQGEQLKAALSNDKIQNAMQIAALGMEIGDGSPASMTPFVEQLGTALEGYMQSQGINISKSQFVQGLTKTGTNSIVGSENAPGTNATLEKVQSHVDEIMGSLPAKVNADSVKNEIAAVAKGTRPRTDMLALSSLPGADKYVWIVNGQTGVRGQYDKITPRQEAYDYLGFYNLVKMGVPEKTAGALVGETIGADRFKTAYKALTGKDWAG